MYTEGGYYRWVTVKDLKTTDGESRIPSDAVPAGKSDVNDNSNRCYIARHYADHDDPECALLETSPAIVEENIDDYSLTANAFNEDNGRFQVDPNDGALHILCGTSPKWGLSDVHENKVVYGKSKEGSHLYVGRKKLNKPVGQSDTYRDYGKICEDIFYFHDWKYIDSEEFEFLLTEEEDASC